MRILACDDDTAFLDRLEQMTARWSNDTGTHVEVETFDNGDDLLAAHAARRADAVLLDMIMPLLDGMGCARELRRADATVRIVFLTSSPEFALESYEVKAYDYLLKPVAYERVGQLLDELARTHHAPESELVVKTADGFQALRCADIEFAEARNKRVRLHLRDGRDLEGLESFRTIEDRLAGNATFFKCHRSYQVNLRNIDHFGNTEITTRSGAAIPLARSCKHEFQDAYFAARFDTSGR